MYRSLIASAVRRTEYATRYLYLPSGPIRPGDLVRYDPARPYVVSHARDIPLIEVLEALQRSARRSVAPRSSSQSQAGRSPNARRSSAAIRFVWITAVFSTTLPLSDSCIIVSFGCCSVFCREGL